jgi:putative transposase
LRREYEAQEARRRSLLRQCHLEGGIPGKLLSPSERRQAVIRVCDTLEVSERRACRALGQYRSTQRCCVRIAHEEEQLTNRIVELATTYGRYGYRLVIGLLRNQGWRVNRKGVERI